MSEQIVTGDQVISINTLSSMYDNGKMLEVKLDNGEQYRISVDEIIKLLNNNVIFEVEKGRRYNYLHITKY